MKGPHNNDEVNRLSAVAARVAAPFRESINDQTSFP